jgi:hypothetical protein
MFPSGISQFLIGGMLAGVGTSLVFLAIGYRAGHSTFFSSTFSFFSKLPYFKQEMYVKQRAWRLIFALGTVAGGFGFLLYTGTFFTTSVQWWRLLAGGVLIGFGARLSRGCTSGHGICGISSFSIKSIYAVVTFMIVAIGTALLVETSGVLS